MRVFLGKPLNVQGKYVTRPTWRESSDKPYYREEANIDFFIPNRVIKKISSVTGKVCQTTITDGYYTLVCYYDVKVL